MVNSYSVTCQNWGYLGDDNISPGLNIIVLGRYQIEYEGGPPIEMDVVLLYANAPESGTIETILSWELEGWLYAEEPREEPASVVLGALTDAIKRWDPESHPRGKWVQAMRTAYEFADHLIAKMFHPVSDIVNMAPNIVELKRHMCMLDANYLPHSEMLLNELVKKEATRRLKERKAFLIQSRWRHVISNPYSDICRKRLMREFTEMAF